MSWTRALHFKSWADTQDARHTLPLLIRKLVRAVVPADAVVVFPANEQVQRPGLDGIVEVTAGNQFVPTGKSAWEMGVNSDKKGKADEDFNKRTTNTPVEAQRQTTFVFVTPREWRKKDEWATAKKNSDWKDIIALGANDLEHWIELCPAVDVWFSTMTGRRPEGLIDLAARWTALSRIAAHPLSPKLLLTGRDSSCAELLNWFNGEPASLLLKSESAGDGLDFLSALAAAKLEDSPHLERMFVVDGINAWRSLSINREAIILVASASLALKAEDVSEAVGNGHHVLIPGGRTAAHLATELQLPRQESYGITTELKSCGFDDSTARSMALGCCGSSSVLKRLLTQHPQTDFPEWSKDENRAALAPFALLGGWVHVDPEIQPQVLLPSNTPIDLMCIKDFMGITRESLEATVARWCGTDDALFLRFGSHIVVGSREDSWYLLGSAVTPQMLSSFEKLALFVLDEDNPALDLESKDRWMANIYGKSHSLSAELRKGILESLVLMAIYPTAGKSAFNVDFHATVRRVLSGALPEGVSWKRWATFDRQLQLFAEADPDFLLSRIETDLCSVSPQIPRLFENGGTGVFSSSLHCGLLWALEKIAWNPALLGRVTNVLARLVEIERTLPASMGNRPSKTLNGIYLWWLPHTNATVEERIAELRRLINNHPDVGWSLLVDMLPSGSQSICHATEMPRWRDWAVGWSREKVHREIPEYALRIAALVVDTAADSPQKWSQILGGIFRFSAEVTGKALKMLTDFAATCEDPTGRSTLWKNMRDLIGRHQAYPDADWTLEAALLQQLSAIRDQLEPTDPVALNEWLFDHHPNLPRVDTSAGYDLYHTELESRRAAALQEIVSTQGWDGVCQLIGNVCDVSTIGRLVGSNQYLGPADIGLWNLIESDNSIYRQFAASYVAGAFNTRGFDFLEKLKLEERTPEQAAKVLYSMPFERPTWHWIDSKLDAAFSDAYWQLCRGMVRSKCEEDVTFAVEKLLQARRPFWAAGILQMAIPDAAVDAETIYRVLEAGLSAEQNREEPGQLDSYAVQQLIKHLQEHSSDQLPRLARLEWGYLPVLDRHNSEVGPATLVNELQTNPPLFVDLLKVVFPGANEEPREQPPTEFERKQCRQAHDLLEAFSKVPGTSAEGVIDESHLSGWTTHVRSLALQEDRLSVADNQLGRLFSRYPRRNTENWPPLPICRVMENSGSDEILNGFTEGLISGRGVTCRAATTGGEPERKSAASYRAVAAQHQTNFPRLANALRNLAEYYDRYAKREDEEAERRRLDR